MLSRAALAFILIVIVSHGALDRPRAAPAGSACDPPFKILGQRLAAIETGWTNDAADYPAILSTWNRANFTDPRKFDPKSFKLVIEVAGTNVDNAREFVRDHLKGSPGSASIVSDRFLGNFPAGDWGVVLELPPENVVATAPFDMNIMGFSDVHTDEFFRTNFGLHTPDSLLDQTAVGEGAFEMGASRVERLKPEDARGSWRDSRNWNGSRWNEIKFRPVRNGSSVVVRGLFFSRQGTMFRAPDPKVLDRLKEIAAELNLPLVIF